MQYDFEWDFGKARINKERHGVSFELAAGVFKDKEALSVFDDDHSAIEDRWITMGVASSGAVLVVHHTFRESNHDCARIRIISSRKANKHEEQQYFSKSV